MKKLIPVCLSLLFLMLPHALRATTVESLRCEDLSDPLGMDVAKPRLSWKLETGEQTTKGRGQKQTAYQVLVASSPKILAKNQGDLWDSGRIKSDQSVQVEYGGKPLASRMQYHWKVRVWDADGKASPWSSSACWTMGVLDPQNPSSSRPPEGWNDAEAGWSGKWIAAQDVPMKLPTKGPFYIPEKNPPGHFVEESGLGYHAGIAGHADTLKWVQVDLKSVVPIEKVRICALNHDDAKGFGFPLRYRLEASDTPDFLSPWLIEDRTAADVPNPGDTWVDVAGRGVSGRYVRFTATKLFARPKQPTEFCFGLKAMQVISGGINAAFEAPVTALDSVEAHGWGKGQLSAWQPPLKNRLEAVLVRRDVALSAKPVRAIARVAGLGFADLFINGRKVGDRVMSPSLTDYTKRVYYNTYNVTDLLREGSNTLAAVLGNGYFSTPGRGWGSWYGVGIEPVVSVDIELVMADGTRKLLGTDGSWKWSTGEITFNDFFAGETQDLRLVQPGWNAPGFNDSHWQPVAVVKAPPGRLKPNPSLPVRACEVVKPIRVEGNKYIFDAMYSGWPTVRVRGKAGQVVEIGGSLKYQYTLKGEGEEVLEPRFSVHTLGTVITVDGIEPSHVSGVTINRAHADLKKMGEFSCSNAFLNRVYEATLRTHLGYTYDFPMDPTREKTGWTQDVQSMFTSASFMTDMQPLYRRWWQDFRDSQTPDGAAGSVVPMVWGGQEHCWDDPWWSGMIVYTPWKLYQFYGDKEILVEAFESMKSYLNWLTAKADSDGIMKWSGASDWIEVGIDGWGPPIRTPGFLVSHCAWYLYADIVSQSAGILGKAEEAKQYAALARKIRDTLNEKHFDPATGLYAKATDSQTALILPLCLGMVPAGKQELVVKRLEENIHQWKDHLSTGFVGTPYLLEGLADFGLAQLSYKICTQQDYAGWNTLITDGVMKETWRGGMAQMPSLGGSIGQWFYQTLAGIRPAAPGFKKIIINPSIVGDLTWVNCWHDSPYGRTVSNWKREGDRLTMEVTIPANTTATIFVPCKDAATVNESGKPAATSEGVTFLRQEGNAAVYTVGSGVYRFESALNPLKP